MNNENNIQKPVNGRLKTMSTSGDIWFVEWTYSPVDYFGKTVETSCQDYHLTIKDGKAEVRTSRDPRPNLCDQLNSELEYRFQGVQLVSHKPYNLSPPSVTCKHPNGKRTVFMETSSTITVSSSSHVDITITDKNGNVVADTRAERIERKQQLSELAVKHCPSDPLAGELLLHYSKAINDRDHFLVHLYDIIDALTRHFGKEKKAKTELKIAQPQWRELCRLANKAPLREGRHRALAEPSELRNATQGEWDTAMDIAAEIIEKYLRYPDHRATYYSSL